MIKGVNWVDLNQKHRQKQKQFDKLPNREKAKIIVDHINYIVYSELYKITTMCMRCQRKKY